VQKSRYILLFMLGSLVVCFLSCSRIVNQEDRVAIDSLNIQAFTQRYKSLDSTSYYINKVYSHPAVSNYSDGLNIARINDGFVQTKHLRFDSAEVCYSKVLESSNNDLICGIADVGMMNVCNMTAQSKEFYDYRNDALSRIKNVDEEGYLMSDEQKRLYLSLLADFHSVSISYFINMRQNENVKYEFQWFEDNLQALSADTIQFLNYLKLSSMLNVSDGYTENSVDAQRRTLVRMLQIASRSGLKVCEADAMFRLSRSVMRKGGMKPSQLVYIQELLSNRNDSAIEKVLAERSLDIYSEYGDWYGRTEALILLSDYQIQHGQYSNALDNLDRSLQLINVNHREMNKRHAHKDDTQIDVLYSYSSVDDSVSTEMIWIADKDIIAIPQWMAIVREQLSVLYGAMGMKAESDYNHNIYFDILDATRQDQRVLQEKEYLDGESQWLNALLIIFGLLFLMLVWGLIVYNKRSKKSHAIKVGKINRVFVICEKMANVLSEEIEDEDDLDEIIHNAVDEDVVSVYPAMKDLDWTKVEISTLKNFDRELFQVLRVFYEWIKSTGLQYITYKQTELKLDSDTYLLEKKFEDNKRQYIEKLTSMSIVQAINPFLDRALHVVHKLKTEKNASSEQTKERIDYLVELIERINMYNDVLGHWVKIKRGMINLSVESFPLAPLFEMLSRGNKSFELKGVSLNVKSTESSVRADKAMTIFMMNTLLDNARKYTPSGGSVTLDAKETDEYVEISVSDTGHGMTADDVDTINNNKVYDSSKIGVTGSNSADIKQNKGFGFGLMNCKGIIEKYRKSNAFFSVCHFGVESEIGKGSRFFFRLPKGIVKIVALLMMLVPVSVFAEEAINENLSEARSYADSIFDKNLKGDYERSLVFADSAIMSLNKYYKSQNKQGTTLMSLEGDTYSETQWWDEGFVTDYDLIIQIRNEVSIAALALNKNHLYHYNSECFTRLYKLMSTDINMRDQCLDLQSVNKNKKTLVIVFGLMIFVVVVVFLFMKYSKDKLIVFNLRQFIQLNNSIFSCKAEDIPETFHQALNDIIPLESVGVLLLGESVESVGGEGSNDKERFYFTGDVDERDIYEGLLRTSAYDGTSKSSFNGRFRTYPLRSVEEGENKVIGALGVCFHNNNLAADERSIMKLVSEILSIYTYFSFMKVHEMDELIEQKEDLRLHAETEQQKVHVQNMIMDNCMSTFKHETMYYPSRIKQLVDEVCENGNLEDRIGDINELLSYYKEIYTILSNCAGKQVERVLFRRTTIPVAFVADMFTKTFKKLAKKARVDTALKVGKTQGLKVLGDKIYLQSLIENVLSLYFEHHTDDATRFSGGELTLDFEMSEGFVNFALTDDNYVYPEELLNHLFYVETVKYDALRDNLTGAQYMLCRQIIREHDEYCNRRGCRIGAENLEDGFSSRFTFSLPSATS